MRELPLDPHIFEVVDFHGDGDTLEHRSKVVDALDELPPELQDVLNGVFWERKSQRALARSLGISRAEVQRRYHTALGRLLEAMSE